MTDGDEHSSLFDYGNYLGSRKFYSTMPEIKICLKIWQIVKKFPHSLNTVQTLLAYLRTQLITDVESSIAQC